MCDKSHNEDLRLVREKYLTARWSIHRFQQTLEVLEHTRIFKIDANVTYSHSNRQVSSAKQIDCY